MKSTQEFETVISNYLNSFATSNPNFQPKLANESKSIKECIQYILSQVKKSGICGFTDDEIFSMAIHYYDESNLKFEEITDCKVIINHQVALTEEEIKEAKKQAQERIYNEEKSKIQEIKNKKNQKSSKTESSNIFTLF